VRHAGVFWKVRTDVGSPRLLLGRHLRRTPIEVGHELTLVIMRNADSIGASFYFGRGHVSIFAVQAGGTAI